jgi:magnesium chelatase subunit D
MERAKEALLLLAVDPGLKGVLIAGGPGTAKTILARSFRALAGEEVPFVEAPLGMTEESLLGGVDFERTLRTGRRCLFPGLLARADGGVLFVDEVNLLEPWQAHVIGAGFASRFALIGTYDPREGPVAAALRDAVGLHVDAGELATREERAELMKRVLRIDPAWAEETVRLRARIAAARRRLGRVVLGQENLRQLSAAALSAGVEGHRADLLAARAARARAALMGRDRVEAEDLQTALEMVVLPRAARGSEAAARHREPAPTERGEAAEMMLEPMEAAEPRGVFDVESRCAAAGKAVTVRKNAGRGRYIRPVADRRRGGAVALEATVRAAAGNGGPLLRVKPRDLRFKQFRRKSGVLAIFAVDASGSMALNRIQQAKGALLRLLRKAYVHRDRIALISFRGREAELLLPPSRSVERAARAVERLAVGGGTPLGAALHQALEVARGKGCGAGPVLLALLTDGRANVAMNGLGVWEEIEELGAAIQTHRVQTVVIDTARDFAGDGEGQRVARLLGGRYLRLEPTAAAAEVMSGLVESVRRR